MKKELEVRPEGSEVFSPRSIGSNWLACFACGSTKDGYSDLDEETDQPIGERVPSVLEEDGIHYSGGYYSVQPDMASFVQNREAGQRVLTMFEQAGCKAFLDFRPQEPNWVQVKVGACEQHLPNLERLQSLVDEAGRSITPGIISQALAPVQENH